MMEILKYLGYEGTAELDMDRGVCRGKVLFITDLVTYQADTPKELQAAFEASVDDYVETCATLGREPVKPMTGQFNVRIGADRHRALTIRAAQDDLSLNAVVVKAVDCYLEGNPPVTNHFHIATQPKQDVMSAFVIPGEREGAGDVYQTIN